jgi:hypothetical protein
MGDPVRVVEPETGRCHHSVRLELTESTSSVKEYVVNARTSPLCKRAPADLKKYPGAAARMQVIRAIITPARVAERGQIMTRWLYERLPLRRLGAQHLVRFSAVSPTRPILGAVERPF